VIIPRFVRRLFRPSYDGLRHFRVVHEGVLYRCGQPSPAQISELIEKHRLRTVVALRGSRDPAHPDAWEAEERAACTAGGAQLVTLPCNHRNPPTAEQVGQFLELVNDARRAPVLVHCRLGLQRTGMFCALYRVHVQGLTPDDALREMDDLGFDSGHRRHQALLIAYRELAATPGLRDRDA
jgi:tyrosine-protein phosphatase SIW14